MHQKSSVVRPDIFGYHDYRIFLKDWLAFLKAGQSGFSMRELSRRASLSAGFLPQVISGRRSLSLGSARALAAVMRLRESESSFFRALVELGTASDQDSRHRALSAMRRYPSYRAKNPKEAEVHRYLAEWYYVAIREMASIPGFKADPVWIAERLDFKVGVPEIRSALEFLETQGYLKRAPSGGYSPPDRSIDCEGGIYRLSLGHFHREMLKLAAESIEAQGVDERRLQGYTLALTEQGMAEAWKIVDEALVKFRNLAKRDGSVEGQSRLDRIYHLELAFFRLVQNRASKDEGEVG